jgi:hypothetical protein
MKEKGTKKSYREYGKTYREKENEGEEKGRVKDARLNFILKTR